MKHHFFPLKHELQFTLPYFWVCGQNPWIVSQTSLPLSYQAVIKSHYLPKKVWWWKISQKHPITSSSLGPFKFLRATFPALSEITWYFNKTANSFCYPRLVLFLFLFSIFFFSSTFPYLRPWLMSQQFPIIVSKFLESMILKKQ